MEKIIISEEIVNKAMKFAEDCVGSNKDKYASRGQNSNSQIQYNIKNGKIGEELVYQWLSKKYKISLPDYTIFDKSEKSYDSDLKGENIRISCKAQNINENLSFSESWVFQNGKNDYDKEIFGENRINTYIAFVSLNIPKRFGEIKAIVTNNFLHENNLFKPMKLESLQNNKVAVYLEDLEKFDNLFLL